ncbi:uncharacterized protein [Halyomorpha halys]|uniref:uncharacterized protein n=1 Tax=Halyomorpha halys TaxID=286706 RepID=UPI0006D51C40|nr:uncharacterized protein LOC106687715 [Halyomorpha halys]
MEARPDRCKGSTTYYTRNTEKMPRGDAIIRDHQVDAGTHLSALVGFQKGRFRVVEKPILPEAYTVLLFSFSSSELTTTCIKLFATSRFTEVRLKSYPSKVKIVSANSFQIAKGDVAMVKRLVLFKKVLPSDVKQNNANVLVPQGEQCHIKYIAVHQTANSNIVVFATETMPSPCYLADENNQCDCNYVLTELSGRVSGELYREPSQKLQYDSTATPVCMQQCEPFHVCMFCGRVMTRAKPLGRICDGTLTKQICSTSQRPKRGKIPKMKLKSKKKNKNKNCGCCPKKRKDQSDAYILRQGDDCSFIDDESQIRRNRKIPCYTDYNRCLTVEKPCPEYKQYQEYKPCHPCNTSYNKCSSEEILRKERTAAKKGNVACKEYRTSDIQKEVSNEKTEFFLVCQGYQIKSNKGHGKRFNGKPETTFENCKKARLQSERDHISCLRSEKWPNHQTKFDAPERSLEESTKSINKQFSTEEEVKEISLQSTESYLLEKARNAHSEKDKNLFIGRMERSSFHAYPFRKGYIGDELSGRAESNDIYRKFPSLISRSSKNSYLSVGKRRSKRFVFTNKLGFLKAFPYQQRRIAESDISTCCSSNVSRKYKSIQSATHCRRTKNGTNVNCCKDKNVE